MYKRQIWGRVRKTVESYREQAQASAADLAAVNLSMHSDLATYYFLARSLDAEQQLLDSTVTQYQQALDLIQSRYAGGIASEVEVQQASTQLETTRAAVSYTHLDVYKRQRRTRGANGFHRPTPG